MQFPNEAGGFEETTFGAVGGASGGDGDGGAAVDGTHECRFATPVDLRALDDAERVDPEVLESESAGDVDGVEKCFGELLFWDCGHQFFEVVFLEREEITGPPAMA